MKQRWLSFALCSGIMTLTCGLLSLATPQGLSDPTTITIKTTGDPSPVLKAIESLEMKPNQIKVDRSGTKSFGRMMVFSFFGFTLITALIVSVYEFSYDIVGKYLAKNAQPL